MKKTVATTWAAAMFGIGKAFTPASAAEPREQVIAVPGLADFLAVDGKTVWATNSGRVER